MKELFRIAFALLLAATVRADFVYNVDFNGTNLDSRLYVVDSPPQFGATLTGTQLQLWKEEGADAFSGAVNIYSTFYLTGDFSISIRGFRGPGLASTGLSIQSTTTEHWQAMYMTGPEHFWAAYCHPTSGCDSRGVIYLDATNVVFRIRREGLVVRSEYDLGDGEGFTTLIQTELSGFDLPMRLKLFLVQEQPGAYPPPYTVAASGLFDNLLFQSEGVQGFVPGTYTVAATIRAERQICWPTEAGKKYQLQWTPWIDTENWLNIGGPVLGDGSEGCFTDLEAADDARFYRVETLPQ
ncbi:MAG TPA: hypothetical protein PLX89_16505 [Verrucomicrobiota bacterium]|nr:hypothetical protein [Verrucomicrobiales bacterium]HRI14598.1 hypothetical protein [Verrucomicrobiota bacterium]